MMGKYVGDFEGVKIFESGFMGNGYGSAAIALPGRGIIVGEGVYSMNLDPWLIKHEFGHFLQVRIIGYLQFYLSIGVKSLLSAVRSAYKLGGSIHRTYWTETWANYLAYHYFERPKNWPMDRFPF